MSIENEFFTEERPSFESVLYWKNKQDQVNDINEMIQRFRIIFDDDREKFYEYNYDFFIRTVSLLSHYKNFEAFEDIYYLYIQLSIDEEDIGLGSLENYLSNGVLPKNQDFLLREWRILYNEYDFSDYVVIETLELLIKTGYFSQEIDSLISDLIGSEDPGMLSSLVMVIDNFPKAKSELNKRLKFVAPMVKYIGGNRFSNPYISDWVEFSEAYLMYFKNISLDDLHEEIKIIRSEDDQFLINCLGGYDERIRKLNKKYITKKLDIELDQKSRAMIATREKFMKEEFLDKLPDTYQEWLSSPFLDPLQREEMMDFMDETVKDKMILKKSSNKIGRNDPCPCDSGKKYKKCCLD